MAEKIINMAKRIRSNKCFVKVYDELPKMTLGIEGTSIRVVNMTEMTDGIPKKTTVFESNN